MSIDFARMRLRLGFPLVLLICGCLPEPDITVPAQLSGSYLGQKPPGATPEIFAPGLVSTGRGEYNAVVTRGGNEFYFVLAGAPHRAIVSFTKKDSHWAAPVIAPFSEPHVLEFCFSPEGDTVVLVSRRPIQGDIDGSSEIHNWMVERTVEGWSEPAMLDAEIAGPCCVSPTGDIFFSTPHLGGMGGDDIFVAKLVDGQYAKPVNVGLSINTELHETDPFLAPDQSYIVFVSADTRTGVFDLWVSFRMDDGTWSQAETLGEKINSDAKDLLPTVSPDGKYLFFSSERETYSTESLRPLTYDRKIDIVDSPGNGWGDIWWVDTSVIEDLRPRRR